MSRLSQLHTTAAPAATNITTVFQTTTLVIMGVDIETLQAGDGSSFPRPGQKVQCHYVLTLTNGTKVDSSRDRGQPFAFTLGRGEVCITFNTRLSNYTVVLQTLEQYNKCKIYLFIFSYYINFYRLSNYRTML